MILQTITLHLDGITAADYLAWVREPEPATRVAGLRSVRIDADPLGATVHATLAWERSAPAPHAAAPAAGLPLSADVRALTSSAAVWAVPERLAA
jgi:hypothetical protein